MLPDPAESLLAAAPPATKTRARQRRRALLILGCLVVLTLLASAYWQAAASLRALDSLQAQADRIGRLDKLLIQLADAESSVRGYLLSRNRLYLEPYDAALATIGYTLEDIRNDLAPGGRDDAELAELSELVAQKLRILARAVERGGGPQPPAADSSAGATDGKRYMDRIRDTLAVLKTRELIDGQHALQRSASNFQRMQWGMSALAAGALLLILALYFLLQRQLQLREQIADLLQSENRRLETVVSERTAELSQLASYLTRTRETEKARLARELHDELGALLTAARMDAQWLERKLDAQMADSERERLQRLQEMLNQGILFKRRLIDDLRPPLLQELGLVPALRDLAEDFAASSGLRLILNLPEEDPGLPPERALALYRIAQEGLTNIGKHAQARHVRLQLRIHKGRAILSLQDDGRGFDPAATSARRHGLTGMRHRVQMFAGNFRIDSRPGKGTRITAGIEIGEKEKGGEGR